MLINTVTASTVLVVIGVSGYYLGSPDSEGNVSLTALIPAFFGFALMLAAWISQFKRLVMTSIVLSFLIGLSGMIGSGLRIPVTYAKYTDGGSPLAFICQLLMSLVCLVYIISMVRSYIIAKSLTDK